MAITKTGNAVLDSIPFIIGAGLGGYRAQSLTEEDKDKIKKYYNLGEDADLESRNIFRGIIGAYGGSMGGKAFNEIVGLQPKNPVLPAICSYLLSKNLTNAYSKKSDALKKIRKTASDTTDKAIGTGAVLGTLGGSYLGSKLLQNYLTDKYNKKIHNIRDRVYGYEAKRPLRQYSKFYEAKRVGNLDQHKEK